jgi:hypothetical protein
MNIRLLLLSFLLPLGGIAQNGLHLQFLPEAPGSAFYQPANLAMMELNTVRFSGDGSLWLNTNSLSFATLQQAENFITEDFKQVLVSDLEEENRFQFGYHYGGQLDFRFGKTCWSVWGRIRSGLNGRFENPLTAGLILRGNAPYAGQSLRDRNMRYRNFLAYETGIGTAFQLNEKLRVGIRATVLHGQSMVSLERVAYELTTAEDGSRLQLNGGYNAYFMAPDPERSDNWGGGLDIGIIYDLNPNWQLQAAVADLGWINWRSDRYLGTLDLDYQGFDLQELVEVGGDGRSLLVTDTLRSLLGDSSRGTFRMSLPTQASLALRYALTEKDMLIFSTQLALSGSAPTFQWPMLNVAYHRHLGEVLVLGVNAYVGGADEYGLGGVALLKLAAANGFHFSLYGTLDNALGLILPGVGQGSGGNAGLSIGF